MPNNPKPLNSYESNQGSEVSSKGILQKEKLSNYNYRKIIPRNRNQYYSRLNLINDINPSTSNITNKTAKNSKNKKYIKFFINKGNEYKNIIDKYKNSSAASYSYLREYKQKYEPQYTYSSDLKYKAKNSTKNLFLTTNPKSEIKLRKNIFLRLKKTKK